MKILIVSKESQTNYGRMGYRYGKALEKLGHNVEHFCYRLFYLNKSFLTRNLVDLLLVNKVKEIKPDILFVFKGETLLKGTIKKISKMGIVTVNWANDEPFGELWKSNKIKNIDEYDFFFVFDKIFINKLKKINENIFQLPPGADPFEIYKEEIPLKERKYKYDLSLLGTRYEVREKLLKQLKQFNPAIAGPSWNKTIKELKPFVKKSKYFSIRDLVRFFNQSKINLNIYYYHTQNSNVVEPHNRIPQSRTFELPASKSFQICENLRDIPTYFEPDKEIVLYDNIDDLKKKISYYLENPSERIKIVEAAYRRIVKEHTLVHRMKTMIEIIESRANHKLS